MNHVVIAASIKNMAGAVLKYRICYQKNDALIFISHLDFQKTFQRAFRRAQVDLAFSEGFNPHPKMTYSPPLSLFVSSAEEYLDVQLNTELSEDEIARRFRSVLPPSLIVNSVKQLCEKDKHLSALIGWGEYQIELIKENLQQDICQIVEDFYQSSENIIIKKRNKKNKLLEKDIKSGIRALRCNKEGDMLILNCILSLVNDTLLNPGVVIAALIENIPALEDAKTISIRKIRTFPYES